MNLLKAIEEVLKSAHEPLHLAVIAEKVISGGLWKSSGKTPEDTIGARLYSDIKKKGEASAFVKVSPRTFVLRNSSAKSNVAPAVPAAVEETANPSSANAGFSFTACAQMVLEEFGGKKPIHYKEITEKALQEEWLVTVGKTPAASMYAQVITEIKRQQKRGERPRFVQHGRGYIGLSQWMGRGLAFQIEQHNNQVRKALRERLSAMRPGEFEELISQLLAEMGFEMVEVTKLSGDGGIDVRGTLVVGDVVRIKMAVQVKKWKLKNNIPSPVVQQVRGSLGAHEQGLIITTSDFSAGAMKEAAEPDKTPIALMNGEQLVMLLMEHGIGVHRSAPDLFEIDEEALVTGEGGDAITARSSRRRSAASSSQGLRRGAQVVYQLVHAIGHLMPTVDARSHSPASCSSLSGSASSRAACSCTASSDRVRPTYVSRQLAGGARLHARMVLALRKGASTSTLADDGRLAG